MTDQELPPARFVFDVAGDVSHGSYGVSRTITATGVRYVIDGPLAQAIKAMLDAHWIAGRDAAAEIAESRGNGWDDDADFMARGIAKDIRALTPPEDKS